MKKIILIAAGLIVLIGGFFFYRSLSGAKTASTPVVKDIKDDSFVIAQGGNKVSGQYVDPTSLNMGVSVYPNSTPSQDQKAAGNFDLNGVKLTAATYQTTDSRSSVIF